MRTNYVIGRATRIAAQNGWSVAVHDESIMLSRGSMFLSVAAKTAATFEGFVSAIYNEYGDSENKSIQELLDAYELA